MLNLVKYECHSAGLIFPYKIHDKLFKSDSGQFTYNGCVAI